MLLRRVVVVPIRIFVRVAAASHAGIVRIRDPRPKKLFSAPAAAAPAFRGDVVLLPVVPHHRLHGGRGRVMHRLLLQRHWILLLMVGHPRRLLLLLRQVQMLLLMLVVGRRRLVRGRHVLRRWLHVLQVVVTARLHHGVEIGRVMVLHPRRHWVV
jgi:hypothetical protein